MDFRKIAAMYVTEYHHQMIARAGCINKKIEQRPKSLLHF